MLNGQQFKYHLSSSLHKENQSQVPFNKRIQHLLLQIQTLKNNEFTLKQRNHFLELEFKKQKVRSQSLVQQLEDGHLLNSKLQDHHQSQLNNVKAKCELEVQDIKKQTNDEMIERLRQKDMLIKEIRLNNEQSEDFLRKRLLSYENQYRLLEENYKQLKELFDEYQTKSNQQKSKWSSKNKQLEAQLYSLKRNNTSLKLQQDNLQNQYSALLQKSAKSERRISNINHEIQEITRQYSKKLLNNNMMGRKGHESSTQKSSRRSYDTTRLQEHYPFDSKPSLKSRYESQHHLNLKSIQHPRVSPSRHFETTKNKENSSFFSNGNGVSNFMQCSLMSKFEDEHKQGVLPSSDRGQSYKKRGLQDLVINSERESLRPSLLQVQTPCFEEKIRFQKREISKIRKINLRSRK